MECSCECGNEPSGSIKCLAAIKWLSNFRKFVPSKKLKENSLLFTRIYRFENEQLKQCFDIIPTPPCSFAQNMIQFFFHLFAQRDFGTIIYMFLISNHNSYLLF
jgi:hypothetical protein